MIKIKWFPRLWLILLSCLLLRIGYQLFYIHILRFTPFFYNAVFDPGVDSYEEIALNLVKGKGYSLPNNSDFVSKNIARRQQMNWPEQPTALRAPTYPLFLYQLYQLTDVNRTLALFMQAVFDTGTCLLIYLIAQQLFTSPLIGLLSSLLWSFYLPGILLSKSLYSEPMFTFLLGGAILLMIKAYQKEQTRYFAVAGIGFGLSSLCHPVVVLFPLVWLLFYLLKERNLQALRNGLIMFLAYGLMLTPWIARNYQHFDQFIPGSTRGGYSLYSGNAALGDDNFFKYLDPWEVDERVQRELHEDLTDPHARFEGLVDDALMKRSFELIKHYPLKYLALCLNRFFLLWLNIAIGIKVGIGALAYALVSLFFLVTAFKGLSMTRPWDKNLSLIWGLVGYISFVFLLTEARWHFALPLMPFILIFSSAYLIRSGTVEIAQ